MIKVVLIIIGAMMIAAAAGAGVWVRLAHPELTETQLFLGFWHYWLQIVVLVLLGRGVIELGLHK